MRASAPAVSVIIPCYNLGGYLDQAVQSVLEQTYEDFEILIIDDGSTDPATQHLFASYERPKTRIIRTQNQGLAKARNLGIGEAKGHYVSCLDADDLFEATFLERTVEVLESNPSFAFASCWLKTFGESEFLWHPTTCEFPHLLAEDTVCTAAVMRKDNVIAVGGFDPGMPVSGYEDWDLAMTLVKRGMRGTIIPEYLFRYRIRAGSMSAWCTEPRNHSLLMRYLIGKHDSSYKQHLPGVLEAIENRTLELENSATAVMTNLNLELIQRLQDVEKTLSAVLQSRNWRLTRPIRRGLSYLQRASKALGQRKSKRPRISVIINCESNLEDLRKSLDSLLFLLNGGEGQIILVVADRCVDPIVREMIDWYYDAGVDVLYKAGATSTDARAAGLKQAKAPILFALNAGDVADSSVFLRAMNLLESDESIEFIPWGSCEQQNGFNWLPESGDLPGLLACPRVAFPMLRSDVLQGLKAYDAALVTTLQADWDLILRIAEQGARGTVLQEAIVYRRNANSITSERTSKGNVVREVVQKHRSLFDRHYPQVILGHENQRRKLQSHLQAGANSHVASQSQPAALNWGDLRRLQPVSPVWGIDRGQPLDRYYIERFLNQHKKDIRGRVLEVKDAGYTRAYGVSVEANDVVDISAGNSAATIVGDLRNSEVLPVASFDCFILTQTLHIIYEIQQVIKNAAKALRPDGVLLATLPSVSRIDYESGLQGDCWRVTPVAAKKLFEEVFGIGNVEAQGFGNVLVCSGFLMGLASGELTQQELNHNDPYFPLVVCLRAIKRPAGQLDKSNRLRS
jgi:glycosyltransferase involved in cell wall biosynthesis/SAM-dependent methyltransferase